MQSQSRRKQFRRAVHVRLAAYDRVAERSSATGEPMSALVERALEDESAWPAAVALIRARGDR